MGDDLFWEFFAHDDAVSSFRDFSSDGEVLLEKAWKDFSGEGNLFEVKGQRPYEIYDKFALQFYGFLNAVECDKRAYRYSDC